MNISLSPYVPENLVSRDGLAVPSRVSLLILHTQAESGVYSRDSSRFPRRRSGISSKVFLCSVFRRWTKNSWRALCRKECCSVETLNWEHGDLFSRTKTLHGLVGIPNVLESWGQQHNVWRHAPVYCRPYNNINRHVKTSVTKHHLKPKHVNRVGCDFIGFGLE